MDWNKPLVALEPVYVSKRVKYLLSLKVHEKQDTLGDWMKAIHPVVIAKVKAESNPQAETMGIQILLGDDSLLAKAYCQNDAKSPVIPYEVGIAFEGEDMSTEDAWYPLYLGAGGMAS